MISSIKYKVDKDKRHFTTIIKIKLVLSVQCSVNV